MKDLVKIEVKCHSGYKADEYPIFFYWENTKFEINEILDRWYQGETNPDFPASDYFKVRTPDEKIYILMHEKQSDEWYLWIKGESMNL